MRYCLIRILDAAAYNIFAPCFLLFVVAVVVIVFIFIDVVALFDWMKPQCNPIDTFLHYWATLFMSLLLLLILLSLLLLLLLHRFFSHWFLFIWIKLLKQTKIASWIQCTHWYWPNDFLKWWNSFRSKWRYRLKIDLLHLFHCSSTDELPLKLPKVFSGQFVRIEFCCIRFTLAKLNQNGSYFRKHRLFCCSFFNHQLCHTKRYMKRILIYKRILHHSCIRFISANGLDIKQDLLINKTRHILFASYTHIFDYKLCLNQFCDDM